MIPSELIDHLCAGSDRQLDESLKPRLQALKGREIDESLKADVLSVIADCVNYSLCSGFVLSILQTFVWVQICGGKLEEAVGQIRSTQIEESWKTNLATG